MLEHAMLDVSQRRFDDLASLAAAAAGVSAAVISLTQHPRQWGAGAVDDDLLAEVRALTAHVVAEANAVVVPDLGVDERFRAVADLRKSRFFAGIPLVTPEGAVVGAVCAVDLQPRAWSAESQHLLEVVARQVVDQLEAHRLRLQLIDENAELQRARLRKSAVLDVAEDGFILHDGETVTVVNGAARRLLVAETRQATSVEQWWPLVDVDGAAVGSRAVLAASEARTIGVHQPSGVRWLRVTTREAAPGAYFSHLHDVTKEREDERGRERVAQQQRLVTTGTLAAGVGHEINNPLAYVLANIELSLEELRAMAGGSPSGRMKNLIEALSDAKEGAELIRRIVRGLRALAREDTNPTACDLEDAVDTALHMAMHELRQKASVHVDLKDAPPVLADEARLSQLFVNLLVNAGQAFEQAAPERNAVRITATTRPDSVLLRVADNGPGISAENLARIFDPFFTTKPVGVGTGLGLAICHGIVTGLGGTITCVSTPGQGACFEIELPRAPVHTQQVMFEAPPKTPVGRVLVVDDDAGVSRTVQRTLAGKHHVTAYGDPREALAAIERGDRFDVVFCDVMMPHMRGTELYRRVFRIDPHLASRFVFITGGAADDSVDQVAAQGGISTLEKPFTTEALRSVAERFIKSG